MIIYPAIDLYGGKAVRLYKGDYGKMTVYSDEPWKVAAEMAAKGADHIHIVDLEGAKNGGTPNIETVLRIKNESGAFCEIGGGIRSEEVIDKYISSGVDRVILGTAAAENAGLVAEAVKKYGKAIAVGADIKEGKIAVRGWMQTADISVCEFFDKMTALGVRTVICTDISKDGAMQGTNRELYAELSAKYQLEIIASGGVSDISDITALKKCGASGAIIGKAYYTGAIDLSEAIEVAK